MPSVLLISPHFPPSTLAGVHRARHLAKHLPAHGWRPIVIRTHEDHYVEPNDADLAALVPPELTQVRTSAVPATFARRVGFGDIGLRAYIPISKAIDSSMRRDAPQAVLITGSPYYPMLLAERISKRWRVPVVLDFQDPWVSAEGQRQPRWSKAGLAHRLATTLEPRAVRHATWITSVSETQNDEMAARYRWIDRSRMSAIPIGGDPDDFEVLRSQPLKSAISLDPNCINLCYVGTFLPRATPVVELLFRAAAMLRADHPELAVRLRLIFVGTSNQPVVHGADRASHRVMRHADAAGISDMVREYPARIPYMEALSLLANANGLLLLGSDEPHYTASKIYPALMSGTRFLSIFHANSSSHDILSRAGGGWCHAFTDADQLPAMTRIVSANLRDLATGAAPSQRSPSVYEPYTAHAVSGQFANVFARVASQRA